MARENLVEGWLFDVQEEAAGLGLWLVDREGKTHQLYSSFKPYFYVVGNKSALESALGELRKWKVPISLERVKKKEFYSDKLIPCLKVSLDLPNIYPQIVKALNSKEKKGFELYTCDIPVAQLFFIETGLFPMARVRFEVGAGGFIASYAVMDSPWDLDYELPPLEIMEIEMEGGSGNPAHRPVGRLAVKIRGMEVVIEEDPISSLEAMLSHYDPHIILTHWGDSYIMPKLQRLAAGSGRALPFGRKAERLFPRKKGRSYFTYGKIVFTASSYTFKGRWHFDLENSFTIRECGLEGLIELARLSKIPIQRMARTSTGTCISAMQVERAVRDGYLIPFRKSQVEEFKTAAELLLIDKGGLTYRPVPGFYENVAEIDFASMYPVLMARFNLSPETVNCGCCPDTPRVPEAGYRICRKRKGLIPRTIEPLIQKRQGYKEKKKSAIDPVLKETYNRKQGALKWCLVTCFGYLGYKNARFGKIEAHEATTAWGREMLLKAKEVAEEKRFTFIHGLTDSLWVKREGAEKQDYAELTRSIEEATGISASLEGVYHWLSFLPSKRNRATGVPARFVGLYDSGELKVRGLMARRHDTPGFVKEAQKKILDLLSRAHSKNDYADILETAVLPVVEDYLDRLINGRMTPKEVAILKRLSHDPMGYEHGTMTAAVSQELLARGVSLMPGEAIQMVVTDASAKDPSLRARALGFLDLPHAYDRKKYREIFLDAVKEIDLDGILENRTRARSLPGTGKGI